MIRMHFPDPADSPLQRSPLRVRYAMQRQPDGRMVPVLHYGHGTRELTAAAWLGFQAAGAALTVGGPREAQIVREVLGPSVAPMQDEPGPSA